MRKERSMEKRKKRSKVVKGNVRKKKERKEERYEEREQRRKDKCKRRADTKDAWKKKTQMYKAKDSFKSEHRTVMANSPHLNCGFSFILFHSRFTKFIFKAPACLHN